MEDDSDDYKVGYGRPPLETRFQSGKSGNPGGKRKRKRRSVNLKEAILDVFLRPIKITKDGKRITSSAIEVLLERLLVEMMKNPLKNLRFFREIWALIAASIPEGEGGTAIDHNASIKRKLAAMRERQLEHEARKQAREKKPEPEEVSDPEQTPTKE